MRPIRLGNLPIDAMLPARRTSIGNRTIHLQGDIAGDDRYAAMVSLKDYPPETGAGMLDYILKLPFEMVLTQSMSFIDDMAARSRIERLDRQLSKADEGGSSVQASLDIARDELARKLVAFAEHHLTVMPIATSPAQLDDAVALIGNELGALGASYVREDLNAEPAYWAQLPGNQAYIARRAVISTLNCAGLSSFHAYPYGKPDGNHWGPAITIFETTSGTPFFFNFHQGDVGHTTVFGPTGSGKTVIMAFLILQAYRVSPRLKTIVFDKDRGLDIMVRAAGGTYMTLEPGEPSGWNPLLLDDTEENRVFLYQLLSFMLKPSKESESLTPQEETIIRTAIKSVLKTRDRSYRRLSSLRALLAGSERTEGSLIARLDKWVDHGPYAWLFDNPDDSLDISRRMIGFDMTSILDDPPVRTAALLYMFHRLDEVYDGKAPIINLMDEAWKLLDDDEFKRTMKDYFKTIRKRNGLVIFGTQSADDVVQSSVSRTIIEQTSTNIFFANPKADENSYMEHFGLSRAEFDWVKNGDPASRFMLIKHAKSSVIARVDMSHMPEFIKVLSGREETVREVEMLREEYGDDPKNWLSKFCDWEGMRPMTNARLPEFATVSAVVLASVFGPVAVLAQVPVKDGARRDIQQETENWYKTYQSDTRSVKGASGGTTDSVAPGQGSGAPTDCSAEGIGGEAAPAGPSKRTYSQQEVARLVADEAIRQGSIRALRWRLPNRSHVFANPRAHRSVRLASCS